MTLGNPSVSSGTSPLFGSKRRRVNVSPNRDGILATRTLTVLPGASNVYWPSCGMFVRFSLSFERNFTRLMRSI